MPALQHEKQICVELRQFSRSGTQQCIGWKSLKFTPDWHTTLQPHRYRPHHLMSQWHILKTRPCQALFWVTVKWHLTSINPLAFRTHVLNAKMENLPQKGWISNPLRVQAPNTSVRVMCFAVPKFSSASASIWGSQIAEFWALGVFYRVIGR